MAAGRGRSAFATATPLFSPPLKVAELPYYSGLVNDDKNVLVAMRCRPTHPETVDAVLATWPNVFLAIQRDVPQDSSSCSGAPANPAAQASCFAKAYTDPAGTAVPTTLAHTFSYAGTLFDADHTAVAKWLKDNYGIFPAFSGMGYSVNAPPVVSRPTSFALFSVNQRAPSGPAVMPQGWLLLVGTV